MVHCNVSGAPPSIIGIFVIKTKTSSKYKIDVTEKNHAKKGKAD
ncbi:MAG: hypothetical protein ACRBBZ_07580 [Nitrosopumilus sp.]